MNIDGWKMIHFLSGMPIFRGYVRFRENNHPQNIMIISPGKDR